MKRRKKILQMPVRNAKGGITQYVLRNWSLINKNRFLFDWVTLDKELSFEDELVAEGCIVYHLSCRQEDDEVQFRKELSAILSNDYDAIHLHTSFWRGFLAEELAVKAGVPNIIVHAHSTGIDNPDVNKRADFLNIHNEWKRLFSTHLATHFTACSNSAAEFLFGKQIPRDKITVVRNGIDTRKFQFNGETRTKIRSVLSLNNKFVLLQSGRLEYQKNYDFTLEVFAAYSKLNSNAILLIVGNGSLGSELKEKAKPLGAKVRFLGFRSDIPELLMAADVFLQPSHFEGFSIASIEAQCSGISWLVSESVPEAALPLHKAALPLHKAAWINMLDKVYKNPTRNADAGKQLRELEWDTIDSIKILEEIYHD